MYLNRIGSALLPNFGKSTSPYFKKQFKIHFFWHCVSVTNNDRLQRLDLIFKTVAFF